MAQYALIIRPLSHADDPATQTEWNNAVAFYQSNYTINNSFEPSRSLFADFQDLMGYISSNLIPNLTLIFLSNWKTDRYCQLVHQFGTMFQIQRIGFIEGV